MFILVFPTHRKSRDKWVVVNDNGETPIFADTCSAWAAAMRHRITRAEALEVNQEQEALLTSPRKYGELMTFVAAARESLAANSRGRS